MIPFDHITGALRLDVELFAKSEDVALSEPRNNQVDSASKGPWLLQCLWHFELMREQMMASTVLT